MSILDIFRKPEQAPQQQTPPAGSPHSQANSTVPNSTNTPTQNPSPQEPNPQSPNAQFQDLWKIDPTQQPNQQPNFQLDPQQLQQAAGKLNFAKSVTQDDLAKVAAGGEEAVGALVNILNSFGREVFSLNAQFASNMTESGYKTAQQAIGTSLPDLVKKQFSQQELFGSNPKLRDPALQPLVMAIQSQVSQKYPNASPAEVNSMVSDYFNKSVIPAFSPAEDPSKAKNDQANNYDFSSFLS